MAQKRRIRKEYAEKFREEAVKSVKTLATAVKELIVSKKHTLIIVGVFGLLFIFCGFDCTPRVILSVVPPRHPERSVARPIRFRFASLRVTATRSRTRRAMPLVASGSRAIDG